jgi:hypothetical protein
VIFAGTNGYLDRCRSTRWPLRGGLLRLRATKHADMLDDDHRPNDLRTKTGDLEEAQGRARRLRQDLRLRAGAGGSDSGRSHAEPQGPEEPDRLGQVDAEDHQGDADGRRGEAAPRPGGGRSRAALCRAHGARCSAGLARPSGRRPTRRLLAGTGKRPTSICWSSARPSAACAAASTRRSPASRASAPNRSSPRARRSRSSPSARRAATAAPRPREADRRACRPARGQAIGYANASAIARRSCSHVRRGRVRRLHAVLLALQVGDLADPDRAADHPGEFDPEDGRGRARLRIRAGRGGDPGRPAAAQHRDVQIFPRCSRTPPPNRARG